MFDYENYSSSSDYQGSGMGINDYSLDEFMSSDWRKSLLKHEDEGTWPEGCKTCLNDELNGILSLRQEMTGKTGKHLHVNVGNLCDSDCVMCGSQWSTKTMARLKKHPDLDNGYHGMEFFPVRNIWTDAQAQDNLRKMISWTDHMHFNGGEPLLDKRIWDFLDSIDPTGKSVSFVSNLNTLPSDRGFEILKKFENVWFNASIDGIKHTYEWIRQGLDWNTVIKNVLKIRSMGYKVNVQLGVQAHNLLDLAGYHRVFGSKADYYIIDEPKILRVRNAPRWALERCLSELPPDTNPKLIRIIEIALSEHDPTMLDRLMKHTRYLNGHRKHTFDLDAWIVKPILRGG